MQPGARDGIRAATQDESWSEGDPGEGADMGPGLNADDRHFLDEVRMFIGRHWQPQAGGRYGWARSGPAPAVRAWFEALVARGWSVPHWPVAHGGTGWSSRWLYFWRRELALAEAPQLDAIGGHWAGPALCAWGGAAQQAAFLPGIREARERWCLGFVEPAAGSDRARTGTRAARSGAGYVVDGVKSWVTGAADARWMLTLVRTGVGDPATAQSLLIVDLRSPGVTVEPVRTLDGATGVCRVRLAGVAVPDDQRIGGEGAGAGLLAELDAIAGQGAEPAAALRVLAARLGAVAAELPGDAGRLADDPGFARKLAELGVDLAGLEALEERVVWGRGSAAILAEVLKLRRTGISQRIGELFVEAFGYYSLPYPDPRTIDNEGPIGHDYAFAALQGMLAGRSLSIDGDTGERLRDRIANQLFGY